jgi:hypothetical protein
MIRKGLCVLLLSMALVPANAAAQGRSSNATSNRPSGDDQPSGSSTNIQVEVTISDYVGSGTPQKKTVSVIVTDGYTGRVRSSRNPSSPVLNVDATPRVTGDGRVWLRLIVEYSPPVSEKVQRGSPINESLTVTLQSGKPLVVSQGADPSIDRRVTVEVTATILK